MQTITASYRGSEEESSKKQRVTSTNSQLSEGRFAYHEFLQHNYVARVSKLLNLCDSRVNNVIPESFVEFSAVLEFIVDIVDASIVNRRHRTTLNSFLHFMCLLTDLPAVRVLLSHPKVDVDLFNLSLVTPLSIAVQKQHPEIISELLKRGADALRGEISRRPLDFVAQLGNYALFDLLQSSLAPPWSVSIEFMKLTCQYTPEELAVIELSDPRCAIVESLLKGQRYNIDEVDVAGDTFQVYCIRRKLSKIVLLTIRFGANSNIENQKGETALSLSIGQSWLEAITRSVGKTKSAVSANATVGRVNARPARQRSSRSNLDMLYQASKGGLMAVVLRLLVEDPTLVNQMVFLEDQGRPTYDSCLAAACFYCHANVVQILLDRGANPNLPVFGGRTCLMIAVIGGHEEIFNLLIDSGADVNQLDNNDSGPLHAAILNKRYNLGGDLLFRGANYNQSTRDGYTPAYLAAYSGDETFINLLLPYRQQPTLHGVLNIDGLSCEQMSPVGIAMHFRHINVVKILVAAGAELNQENQKTSPLKSACRMGFIDIVHLLLDAGADPKLISTCGNAPIHVATINGCRDIVKLLIEHDRSSVGSVGVNGCTPLELATEMGQEDIVALLQLLSIEGS